MSSFKNHFNLRALVFKTSGPKNKSQYPKIAALQPENSHSLKGFKGNKNLLLEKLRLKLPLYSFS